MLALKQDGTVVAWGHNNSGQTDVPTDLSNVVAIAAGGSHSLALRSDGSVAAWGDSTFGQTPAPKWLTNVVAVAAGFAQSLALVNDGAAFIARQPLNETIYSGGDALLGIAAVGAQPISYQWRFYGTNIAGANSAWFSLTNASLTNGGKYSCVVTNVYGAMTSAPALLNVLRSMPQFDSSPAALQFSDRGTLLTLKGLSGHGPVIIYTSSNLLAWSPIATNAPVLGILTFLDSTATNQSIRFYRALEE